MCALVMRKKKKKKLPPIITHTEAVVTVSVLFISTVTSHVPNVMLSVLLGLLVISSFWGFFLLRSEAGLCSCDHLPPSGLHPQHMLCSPYDSAFFFLHV